MDDDQKSKHVDNEKLEFLQVETKFSPLEELTLSQEKTLIKFLKRMGRSFSLPTFSDDELERAIPVLLESLKYYYETSWEKVPELYFKRPESLPLFCVSSPVHLSSGEVCDLSFRSEFSPVYPEYEARLKNEPRWRSVRAKYWRHAKGQSRGTIIAVHGWMMGSEKASALTLVPGYFYRMGLDVIIFELPFHGLRNPEQLLPTLMFPGIDPACTNEGFAQAIFELRSIREWLRREDDKPVIGMGLSLGGHTVALWHTLDFLDAAICVAPLVSLPDIIWSQVEGGPMEKRLQEVGISKEVLENGFSVSSPLAYPFSGIKSATMIVAAKNDVIVPAAHATMLWEHWGRPDIHWVDDGHIEQLLTPGTGERIHEFLSRLGFADPELRVVSSDRQ
ncbi:MAG TPA: hypothetical protein PKA63_00195 [Oligoflexia bacterium]|nr:hypothetical protein [Oligoflexia bacterium]HMP47068.1 hypothetical protein [Oligoflexia bacterium]